MNGFIKCIKVKLADQSGVSLIAMALMIMASGLFIAAGARLHQTYSVYRDSIATDDRMDYVQQALADYFYQNGRYPCPAPLNAAIDSAGYGREVTNNCPGVAPVAGVDTFRAAGRDGRMVRTGTVPTRTLNIADSYMIDGYGHRLIYAVTEQYASAGGLVPGNEGGIFVKDGDPNNPHDATAMPGNVAQIVYSMGLDDNGVYSASGALIEPCDPAARSGQNCDFASNAVFINTVNKSNNPDADKFFVSKVTYPPNKIAIPCQDNNDGNFPKDIAFLIDSSGSMGYAGVGQDGFNVKCPAELPGCARIDVVRWALRRVVPMQVYTDSVENSPGLTSMTGFVHNGNGTATVSQVSNNLDDIEFFDPEEINGDKDGDGVLDDVAPVDSIPDIYNVDADNDGAMDTFSVEQFIDDEIYDRLDTEFADMCPDGNTPLGVHIKALADELGNGDPNRPNKVIVLSDGLSNNGLDPMVAANDIKAAYPNLKVDIIDVVGNDAGLRDVAETTGGQYFRADNPDELLEAFMDAAGICSAYTPSPVDKPGCGTPAGVNWPAPTN